jgi:hypothetical protein
MVAPRKTPRELLISVKLFGFDTDQWTAEGSGLLAPARRGNKGNAGNAGKSAFNDEKILEILNKTASARTASTEQAVRASDPKPARGATKAV